jgi:hypothetical protein
MGVKLLLCDITWFVALCHRLQCARNTETRFKNANEPRVAAIITWKNEATKCQYPASKGWLTLLNVLFKTRASCSPYMVSCGQTSPASGYHIVQPHRQWITSPGHCSRRTHVIV